MSGSSGSPGGGRRPRKQEDGDSPESPHVPSGPLTRKRAASLRTDESSRPPRIEDLSLNTPTTVETPQRPGQEGGRDHICLCTPAPKVPRPRNGMCLPPLSSGDTAVSTAVVFHTFVRTYLSVLGTGLFAYHPLFLLSHNLEPSSKALERCPSVQLIVAQVSFRSF